MTDRSRNQRDKRAPDSEFQWPPPREAIDRMFVRVDGDADPLAGDGPGRATPTPHMPASNVAPAAPAEAIEPGQPDPLAYDPSAVDRFSFESDDASQPDVQAPELAAFAPEAEAAPQAPSAPEPAAHEPLADTEPIAEVDAPAETVASGAVESLAETELAADEPPREHFSFEPLPITPAFGFDVLPLASFVPPKTVDSTAGPERPRVGETANPERAGATRHEHHDRVVSTPAARTTPETAASRAARPVRMNERAMLPRHAPGLYDLPAAGRAIAFSGTPSSVVTRRSYRWPLAAAAILLLAAAAAVPWVFLIREGAMVSFAPSWPLASATMAGEVTPPPAEAPAAAEQAPAAADQSAPTVPDEEIPEDEAPVEAPAEPVPEPSSAGGSPEPAGEAGTAADSATSGTGVRDTPPAHAVAPQRVTPEAGPAPPEAPGRRELAGGRVADLSAAPARPRLSPGRPLEARDEAPRARQRKEPTPAAAGPSVPAPAAAARAPTPAPTPVPPDPQLVSEAPTSERAAVDEAPPSTPPPPSPAASLPAAASTASNTANPVPAVASDEQLVSATLRSYARAYERLDATAARRVWPNVDERALARAFDTLESQQFRFDSCRVRVLGQTARADCAGSVTYVPKVGKKDPRTVERRWDFALRKGRDAWQITEATVR